MCAGLASIFIIDGQMTIEERNKKMLSGVMYNDLAAELVEKREQVIFLTIVISQFSRYRYIQLS